MGAAGRELAIPHGGDGVVPYDDYVCGYVGMWVWVCHWQNRCDCRLPSCAQLCNLWCNSRQGLFGVSQVEAGARSVSGVKSK